MLAAFLSRLPSVIAARDLAVANERVRALADQVITLTEDKRTLRASRDALEHRLNRLIDARLLQDGAITAPVLADPPKLASPPAPGPFGAFGRTVYDRPRGPLVDTDTLTPVGADVAG